jgi:hypothetical protein
MVCFRTLCPSSISKIPPSKPFIFCESEGSHQIKLSVADIEIHLKDHLRLLALNSSMCESGLYGKAFSPLCPSSSYYVSARSSSHSHKEAMRSFSALIVRLVCPLHALSPQSDFEVLLKHKNVMESIHTRQKRGDELWVRSKRLKGFLSIICNLSHATCIFTF